MVFINALFHRTASQNSRMDDNTKQRNNLSTLFGFITKSSDMNNMKF